MLRDSYVTLLVLFMGWFDLCMWMAYELLSVRLLISPHGVVYHTLGYTMRSGWDNVAGLDTVATPNGPKRGLVLNQPGLEMSGWLSMALVLMPALKVVSLLMRARVRWPTNTEIDPRFIQIEQFASDRLLADLQHYTSQISPSGMTIDRSATPPIDPQPESLSPHWPPWLVVSIGVIALEIVFAVLNVPNWQGDVSPFHALKVDRMLAGLAFTSDSQTVLVATDSGELQEWRVEDGTLQQTRSLSKSWHQSLGTKFAVSHDSRALAASLEDGTVQVWHADGTAWSNFGQVGHVSCWPVAFSPDDQSIASGCGGTIHVWRLSDGAETFTLKAAPDAQDDTITEVAFSPDGQRLAASATSPTTTNMVQIWRLDTGNLPGVFPGSGSPDLSFAPDGQLLAVSTDRAGVLLIRPEDHSLSGTLRAPSAADCVRWNDCADRERRAAFSLDNQYIASVTEGGTLQIWRLSDHKLLRTLRVSMTEDIRQLAFSPDGRYLATSAFDDSSFVDTVQLWRVADLTK